MAQTPNAPRKRVTTFVDEDIYEDVVWTAKNNGRTLAAELRFILNTYYKGTPLPEDAIAAASSESGDVATHPRDSAGVPARSNA